MKALMIYLLCGVAVFLWTWPCRAVEVGDAKEAVLAELGNPPGYVGTLAREILLYERGNIVLTDGRVVSVALISEEAFEAQRLRREAEAAEQRLRARMRRERLIAEGTEIRLRKLLDTEFMNAPAAARLAYWQRFRARYPDVDLGEEYAMALRERELELSARTAARASDARIRELELRVARAEAQANQPPVHYSDTTYVSAGYAPYAYGGTYYRRARRPLRAGCTPGYGQHRPCRKPCHRPHHRPSGPTIQPLPSTAGYAFQRPLQQGSGHVQQRGRCGSPVGVTPFRSTAGYAFQRPLYTAGATRGISTVSRGGLSARARIVF